MFKNRAELRNLLHHWKLSSDELNHLQNNKLQKVISHAYENIPYYQSLFKKAGLTLEEIHSVEDLKFTPITTKENLRTARLKRIAAKGTILSSCYPNG